MSDPYVETEAFDGDDLVHCPMCGAQVPMEAEKCPTCCHAVLREDPGGAVWSPRRGRAAKAIAILILAFVGLTIAAAVFTVVSSVR